MTSTEHSVVVCPDLDLAGILTGWRVAMEAEGKSEQTIRLRLRIVVMAARAEQCPVDAMTTAGLRTWLAGYRNLSTQATYYSGVRSFHAYLQREGLRQDNPTVLIRRPRPPKGHPRPCATPSLHAIVSASGSYRPMLVLAAWQGLRAAEVARVRGEDIDPDGGWLYVRGKGGRERTLPLHPAVAELAETMPVHGWWFPSPVGEHRPVRPTTVTNAVKRSCVRAGLPEHGAHRLRHWFATSAVRSGADLRTVQILLGHSSLATTAIYVEVGDDALRAAVLRLPGLPEPDGGAR